jgi:hypothetical protein
MKKTNIIKEEKKSESASQHKLPIALDYKNVSTRMVGQGWVLNINK